MKSCGRELTWAQCQHYCAMIQMNLTFDAANVKCKDNIYKRQLLKMNKTQYSKSRTRPTRTIIPNFFSHQKSQCCTSNFSSNTGTSPAVWL